MFKTFKEYAGVVAVVIAIVALFTPVQHGKSLFGAIVDTSYFDYFDATTGFKINGTTFFTSSGLKVNSTSDTIGRINTGQCYIKPYATTIAATSTVAVDCQALAAVQSTTGPTLPLTGVTTGDNVVVMLATSTAGTTLAGIDITGASASTTAGYITLLIANNTGTTFTWPTTGSATGTASYIVTH